jgi:tRNA G18 (ribose-2'-O)-methylase SpoU
MGGSMYVPVFKRNIYTILKVLKREGIQIICVDPAGSTDLFSEDLTGSVAFVFGGEDRGINPNLMKKCERKINIPMFGQLESLNVNTSVAIVLYERIRQQISQKNK